jgi:hypothetical protein
MTAQPTTCARFSPGTGTTQVPHSARIGGPGMRDLNQARELLQTILDEYYAAFEFMDANNAFEAAIEAAGTWIKQKEKAGHGR